MPLIIGQRIILREYRKEDIELMRQWVNDSEITNNLSDAFLYPHTKESTESYLNSIIEGRAEQKGFIIALKETEEYRTNRFVSH